MTRLALILKLLAIAALMCVFYWTDDLFRLVGSSANISRLIMPSITVQALTVVICAICLFVPVAGRKHAFLYGVALLMVLLGGHRLIVDNQNQQVRDVYLAVAVQTLKLDPGSDFTVSVRSVFWGFQVGAVGGGRSLFVLSPPLLGLNRTEMAAIPHP